MRDFWVGHWLHCPPEENFSGGRRAVLRHLCFGPAETRAWFVTKEGDFFYEEHILEGCQAGEHCLEPCTRTELLRALDREMELCRRFQGEELLPLFQAERDALNQDSQ